MQMTLWPFPTNPQLEPVPEPAESHDPWEGLTGDDWITEYNNFSIKELIQQNHIRVVHLFDKWYPYGGTTIAYRPVKHDQTGYPTGKFGYVAVAYCNPKDRYNRKLGQQIAVTMLMDGQGLLLPIYVNRQPVKALKEIFEEVLAAY